MLAGICTAAGVLFLIYYLVLVLYAGITADFAWIWLLGAAVLLSSAFLIRYGQIHPGFFPGWIRYVVAIVVLAGVVLFFSICGRIIQGMTWKGSANLDYVVVLGAQVKKDVPSRALKKRLIKALDYAEKNPDTILILSGGQGSGEDITEAQCMKEYLSAHGILDSRMVLEEKSTNTKENLAFSHNLTGCAHKRTGIISNNFHVYRAVKLAQKLGYHTPQGIAAQSDPLMQTHYVVREVFAVVKELVKGNI